MRTMLDLAIHDEGQYIKVKDIAKRQDLSEKYLEQIISILNKAGYVKSVRGSQGGYRLTREPKEYTVGMILDLTEGSLAPVSCLDQRNEGCERADSCVTLEIWKQIDAAVKSVVDHVTLADLVEKEKEKAGNQYYI